MDTQHVITTFFDFFHDRGHRRIGPAPLVTPPGDPVLFTTAGMQPLTPYLLGRPHPLGRRLTGLQPCLRTTDLAEVGDPTHLTMFGMLGSWSLGDYPGPQSLRWGYELLRDGFGVAADRLHATVFGGDGQVGPDTASLATWRELGVPVEVTHDANWWSNGPSGPCGPDSEMFVWTGDGPPGGTPGTDPRWMELWNHVSMRYVRGPDGGLEPLPRPSVDTGMGLERLLMVVQGADSVFGTGPLEPWPAVLTELWQPGARPLRVLADHLRTSVAIIGEGILPANTGRGYVLRRLVRRVLTILWRDDPSRTLGDLPASLVPGPARDVLTGEQRRFSGLLARGRAVLRGFSQPLSDSDVRYLHETHGLPPDLITDLLAP